MAKPTVRIAFLQGCLALAALAVLGRAFQIGVIQHRTWKQKGNITRVMRVEVPAWRGTIFDRNGDPLAVTMIKYHINVATRQLRDTSDAVRRISRALKERPEKVDSLIRHRRDVYFHGPYPAQQANQLSSIVGVRREPVLSRAYPRYPRAAPLLGRFDTDSSRGVGGLEAAYDTILRGVPGEKVVTLDGRGRGVSLPDAMVQPPVRGKDIYLSIDANLQVIVENELERRVAEYQADNGDIVILNVHTGEVLAAASLRSDGVSKPVATPSAFIEPYEPGSTAKIFTAAAVLATTGPDPAPKPGYGGRWNQPIGNGKLRYIEDVHRVDGMLTLGDAIKHSSNIAITQFALGVPAERHYRILRDFGFGTSAAIGFPGEGAGLLRRPSDWENNSLTQGSLAQGYEFMSTALQMASAYAVLANGGKLVAPTLLREIRGEASSAWRHVPEVVRQVVDKEVAARALEFLALATDSAGTGMKAQLDRIRVIGKTGTAKHMIGGHYVNVYRSSFAGVYPGDRPQIVIYVMIDKPKVGGYYGGVVAAPAVRSILQQGLSMLRTPLDRSTLAATVTPVNHVAARRLSAPPSRVVSLRGGQSTTPRGGSVPLPSTSGLDVRTATFTLHQRGMIVKAIGNGIVRTSVPSAGDTLPAGSLVTVYADSTR